MSDVLPPGPGGSAQPACAGCGEPATDGAAFCHKCGFPLGGAPPPLPHEPASAAPSPFDAPPPHTTLPGWGEPARPSAVAPQGAPQRATQGTPPGPQSSAWSRPAGPVAYTDPYGPSGAPPSGGRSRVAAALLAFFLGGLGAHKFYLGRYLLGALYLLFCWTLIPSLLALVDFVVLLAMGDEKFQARYGHLPGSGALPVVLVLGAGFVGLVVLGILAAIAIPNFVKYQLRSRVAEVPTQLRLLDQAELARQASGDGYLVFPDGLPAGQAPGANKLSWSEDDLKVAAELGWTPGEQTWARYAADGLEDDEGNQALALCAVTDADEDGELAAWALFRPALAEDGSVLVPPPDAPCPPTIGLREGASLGYDPEVPPGTVVRLSPDDVF